MYEDIVARLVTMVELPHKKQKLFSFLVLMSSKLAPYLVKGIVSSL